MTHEHDHPHAPEARLAPSGHATVLLDVGDGVGALVVHTPAELNGVEIELARRNETCAFTHTEVRERRLPEGSLFAGVFPAIVEGEYTLLGVDAQPGTSVEIRSGHVTEVALDGRPYTGRRVASVAQLG